MTDENKATEPVGTVSGPTTEDLTKQEALLNLNKDQLRLIAVHLWDLLDEIDTISDMVKFDDAYYRKLVEKKQAQRFAIGNTDGYNVFFTKVPTIEDKSWPHNTTD